MGGLFMIGVLMSGGVAALGIIGGLVAWLEEQEAEERRRQERARQEERQRHALVVATQQLETRRRLEDEMRRRAAEQQRQIVAITAQVKREIDDVYQEHVERAKWEL